MSNLVLELRQGDMMVVNGAAIRFRSRTRIELTAHARFLFGRQIMAPQDADTPARRIYFALQTAYIGDDQERLLGLQDAAELIAAFKAATTSELAMALLDSALACAHADKCYLALRLARRVVRHEDAVLGREPSLHERTPQSTGKRHAPDDADRRFRAVTATRGGRPA